MKNRKKRFKTVVLPLLLASIILNAKPGSLPSVCNSTAIHAKAAGTYKIEKKGKKYYAYNTDGKKVSGYYLKQSNDVKKCRLYRFNKKGYMKVTDYNQMVQAMKKQSYKELCKAIGKGKTVSKSKGCNGGKYDYIFQYGIYLVYTTDDKITYISDKKTDNDW